MGPGLPEQVPISWVIRTDKWREPNDSNSGLGIREVSAE